MHPLVRAPVRVALQNLELMASCPTNEWGQTSHAGAPPSGRMPSAVPVSMGAGAVERVTVINA
jgi:hypothetical protein